MADMTAAVVVSLIDEFSANGKKFSSTMTSMKKSVREFAGGVKSGIKNELLPRFDAEGFKKQIEVMDARIAKSKARMTGALASALALAAPLVQAAQFDQAFKGLEKVVDAPISRLKQLRKFALETSALVPIAARDVVELMSEAAQGGVPTEELEKFSLFTANAAIAFDMAGSLIGERFAKLRNVYKLNQDGIEELADATNFLSNNFSAKASEITNFTNRAAGAAKILNTTAVEASAVGAAMIASGIVPETAARGFNTLAARVVKGGKKVDAAFTSIGTSRTEFLAAVKKDGAQAFNQLFKGLSKSENGMAALINLVGTDFSDDFAKLLDNPELLTKTLAAVADRTKFDGSVVEEAAKQSSGAVKKWELMVNKLSAASIQMGDILLPKLLAITDAVGGMVASFSKFASENPKLTSAIITITAALLAFSVAAKVMSFAWAITAKKLFEGMAFFVKLKDGKNVSKLASALMSLPGPLKAIGLLALAAGAAYAFFEDDADRLAETMSKDPEGFKKWEERLFGVKDAADGAADALGRLNQADTAIRLNKAEGAFAAQKDETIAALEDAIETGFFDKGRLMSALLALGPHVFEILPLNYQELDRTSTAAWASIPRFGGRAARQFTGLGEGDGLTISGVIFPEEFGGRAQYEAIRFTQGLGVPLMMVGLGAVTGARIFGLVCVEAVSDTQTHIAPNGQGRVLDFSIDVTPYGGAGGVLGGLF